MPSPIRSTLVPRVHTYDSGQCVSEAQQEANSSPYDKPDAPHGFWLAHPPALVLWGHWGVGHQRCGPETGALTTQRGDEGAGAWLPTVCQAFRCRPCVQSPTSPSHHASSLSY